MNNVILQSLKITTKNAIMYFTMLIINLINTIINNSIINLSLSVLRDCVKYLSNAEHEEYYSHKDLHAGVSVLLFPFSLVICNSHFIVTWSIYAAVVKK